MVSSSQFFFSKGVMYACLKLQGTYPEESDILKTEVMYGANRSIQSFNNHVGIGSRAHCFSGALRIKLVTSLVSRSLIIVNWLSDGLSVNVAGGAFSVVDRMSLIFLEKNVANESAVSFVVEVEDF